MHFKLCIRCGWDIKMNILPYGWWQLICISQSFENMIFLWPPFSCECAGETCRQRIDYYFLKNIFYIVRQLWYRLLRKNWQETFVSSFGVYFGCLAVSFSDITVEEMTGSYRMGFINIYEHTVTDTTTTDMYCRFHWVSFLLWATSGTFLWA